MGWINRHKRGGALLALAALALQLVLSFGHMHRDDLGLPPLPAADQTQLASGAAPAPAGPADQDHHPASDDYCAICASMVLIATAMPSLPPVLIVPTPIRHVWPSQTRTRGITVQIALSFQARAPPAA
jgi:hypothetical protein